MFYIDLVMFFVIRHSSLTFLAGRETEAQSSGRWVCLEHSVRLKAPEGCHNTKTQLFSLLPLDLGL